MNPSPPHEIHPRRDTGQYNARLALWLVLASLIMLLAALYSAYAMLRYTAESWGTLQETLSLPWGLLGIFLQTAMALLLPWGWLLARQGRFGMVWGNLGLCLVLGMGVLFSYGQQMVSLGRQGLGPEQHNFYALFHLLSGLQMLFIGIVILFCIVYLLSPGNKQGRLSNRMECLGLYLQFVAVAGWLHFALFYVL